MKAYVYITLKKGVLDPQGKTVENALSHLGYEGVESVRIGKFMEVELAVQDRESATAQLHEMCDKLFVNPNIEEYRFTLETNA